MFRVERDVYRQLNVVQVGSSTEYYSVSIIFVLPSSSAESKPDAAFVPKQ